MPTRRPIIGGNWKMNTTRASARDLAAAVTHCLAGNAGGEEGGPEVVVIPPFPYLLEVGRALADVGAKHAVRLGAQDLYHAKGGAFTGEVSAAMLVDCCCEFVLTGHSERRHIIGEDDALINAKTKAALEAGLSCILCLGETLDQRKAGQTDQVNRRQLTAGLAGITPEQMTKVVIAYEPVWAIGTGVTATPADAQDAHTKIRTVVADLYTPALAAALRIQYGGSVKGSNAAELMAQPDIDGALVGGASLDAADFVKIVNAAAAGA